MSWHFSRALEEAYWQARYSDGGPSVPSRSTAIAATLSSDAKTTESSLPSRSGTTCGRSTADRGEALLTWYLEVSRAKTSALQAQETASKAANPASGERWPGSFAKYDPDTHSWKTAQCSLLGDSEPFSATWPKSGTMQNGVCWPRAMLEGRMGGPACGSWPTPTATGNNNVRGRWQKSGDGLRTAVMRSLPEGADPGLFLNPAWVERLMGWPDGWTSLRPLSPSRMEAFHRRSRAGFWRGDWEGGTPRAVKNPERCHARITALGNGQVPQCAAEAWRQLARRIGKLFP